MCKKYIYAEKARNRTESSESLSQNATGDGRRQPLGRSAPVPNFFGASAVSPNLYTTFSRFVDK